MNKTFLFSIVSILSVFFLLVLADFVPFWMPMMGEMIALLLVTVLLLGWASFVLFESAVDEREVYVKSISGKIAYLAGMMSLLLALLVQGFLHNIDPFIPVTLAVMICAKLFSSIYFDCR